MDGWMDGWMDGVAFRIFADADRRLYGEPTNPSSTREEAVRSLVPYAESLLAEGQRLHRLTRHMSGARSSSLPLIELPTAGPRAAYKCRFTHHVQRGGMTTQY